MCLISFQWQPDTDQPLILTANRDEFLHRPASALHHWPEHEGIYAGQDLSQGGTWLGVQKNGRFAALTNHRDMRITGPENPITRGDLVLKFLTSAQSPLDYLKALENTSELYAGYNLLVGDHQQLAYFSNRSGAPAKALVPGLYGLSNGLLDSPWPKVDKAKQQLGQWLAERNHQLPLAGLLASTTLAEDAALPDTGIQIEMERALSCQKIVLPNYGTRCSTGLIMTKTGFDIEEISWQADGSEQSRVNFSIENT